MLGIYTILHDFTFFGVKSNSAIVLHLQTDKPLSWLLYCAIDLSTSKVWHYDKILLDRKRTGFVKSCFVQSSPFDWSSVSKSTYSCIACFYALFSQIFLYNKSQAMSHTSETERCSVSIKWRFRIGLPSTDCSDSGHCNAPWITSAFLNKPELPST